MKNPVLKLVTRVDGCSFVLFHVEQQDMEWGYRWKMAGDYPWAYLQWRQEVRCCKRVAVVPVEAEGARVEVEVRVGEGEWHAPEHVALGRGKVEMIVRAEANVRLDGFHHSVFAMVRDCGVARYDFSGAVSMVAGEELRVEAVADFPCMANVLFEPGEFRAADGALTVTNAGPTMNGWVEDKRIWQVAKPRVEPRPFVFAKQQRQAEVNHG